MKIKTALCEAGIRWRDEYSLKNKKRVEIQSTLMHLRSSDQTPNISRDTPGLVVFSMVDVESQKNSRLSHQSSRSPIELRGVVTWPPETHRQTKYPDTRSKYRFGAGHEDARYKTCRTHTALEARHCGRRYDVREDATVSQYISGHTCRGWCTYKSVLQP